MDFPRLEARNLVDAWAYAADHPEEIRRSDSRELRTGFYPVVEEKGTRRFLISAVAVNQMVMMDQVVPDLFVRATPPRS